MSHSFGSFYTSLVINSIYRPVARRIPTHRTQESERYEDVMSNNKSFSLADLAEEALRAQSTGIAHASVVLDGDELSPNALAAMQQAAMAGSVAHQEALGFLAEAKERIFDDAFTRVSYLRGIIAKYAASTDPDPNQVLETFFSS